MKELNLEQHKEEINDMRHSIEKLALCIEEMKKNSDINHQKVDEMFTLYKNGSFLITVLKWVFATILAIGGAYLMFKQIITKL